MLGAGTANNGNFASIANCRSTNRSQRFTYDVENRMLTSNSTLGNASYVYDANGRRIRKTVNTTTITDFIHDVGGSVIAERQSTDTGQTWSWTKGYVYAVGQLLAQYDNSVTPNTTYFAHKDHLGSTRLLTRRDAPTNPNPVVECDGYQPFGELDTSVCSPSTPTTSTTHKFTGNEHDTESELDFFEARYFGSSLGRFMSPDPFFFQSSMITDPQQFNQYAYVRNNPLIFIDPAGEAIQLTGNAESRKQQLAALCATVGSEACPYLYENAVEVGKDKEGNPIYEYYVGIYSNGPNGNGPSFESLNPVSQAFGEIIKDSRVAVLEIVPAGSTIRDPSGRTTEINNTSRGTPGATYIGNDGKVHVALLDWTKTSIGNVFAEQMSNGKPGFTDPGMVLANEFGHVQYMWSRLHFPGYEAEDSARSAVDLENKVRQMRDPNGPTRRREY